MIAFQVPSEYMTSMCASRWILKALIMGAHDMRVLDGAAEERLAQRIHLLAKLPLVGHYLYCHCAPAPPTLIHLPKRPAQQ